MSRNQLRGAAAIVGVAESDLGDVGPDRYPIDLAAQASVRALAEAGLTTKDVDVADQAGLVAALAGNDVVYSTVRFLQANADQIVGAVKKAAVPRLLVVGGAGSLEVAPGVALIDTPQFPKEYFEEASAGRDFLNALRKETELNWTFVSPSAIFEPGERTGHFRVGKDSLLVDANGKPWISMEDFAIAFLDETEKPAHPRQRFTVGY